MWENITLGLSRASLILDIGVILGYLFSGVAKVVPTFIVGVTGFRGSPVFMITKGGEQISGATKIITILLALVSHALDKYVVIVLV